MSMAKKKSRLSKVTLGQIWYWITFIPRGLLVSSLGILIMAIQPLIIVAVIIVGSPGAKGFDLPSLIFNTFIGVVAAKFIWDKFQCDKLYEKLNGLMPK